MSAITYTNESFVAAIKAGGTLRQNAIRWLYDDRELSQRVVSFVKNNRGNQEDGTDMFHEGIIVLDRNIREDKFRGEAPVKGYLYSICRFLWMNQMRKQERINLVDPVQPLKEEADLETPEVSFHSEERKNLLSHLLDQLGEQCRKVLEMWKMSYSMAEIAETLQLSNEGNARKVKYRCHLALMEYLEKNPGMVKQLKDLL
jgi:RNA polymerase sigma factor (sigma-70 family)